ncbi:hypothetical protein PEPCOX59622_00909 [Aedoeadaptatus coxii]|uniref:DUF6483 family protein n=1 Tax=Aedoeadaptatus coxii TaxID=755172 RepID=UPI001755B929|nr:DUF6483 family protein [Peptoniphilus coxii]CAC9931003.1 hypothetical protein PEPCOX59622_00909 [Peptoniphilus coxii]
MLKNDFLMKQIQEYIQFLLRLIFPKEDIALEKKKITERESFRELAKLIEEGRYNDAEDLLFDGAETGTMDLASGIFFYQTLLQVPEKTLHAHDFSTKEIETGLRDYAKLFDVEF